MSRVPCLIVSACQRGDTSLGDQIGCIDTAGDNGEPRAEGMYLHLKSLGVRIEVGN